MKPLFSIIIPTYNRASFLPTAIASIQAQTFDQWECVVVDDGSTDQTKKVIEKIASSDPRIRYVWQVNSERSAARNNGIENSLGQYIAFLDSDDVFHKTYLFELYNAIKENNFPKVLVTKIAHKDLVRENKLNPLFNDFNSSTVKFLLKHEAVISIMQLICHKEIFKNNRFIQDITLWEDTHLFMRILAQYSYVKVPTAVSFINSGTQSSVIQGMIKIKKANVLRYLNAVNSLFYDYQTIIPKDVSKEDFIKYRDAKIKMFLYQARQNRQLLMSCWLTWKGFFNQPSIYFLGEFVKSLANFIYIGIHEKK